MTPWQKRCLQVGRAFGIDVRFHEDGPGIQPSQYEEDGNLHVIKQGECRAVFDLAGGQQRSPGHTHASVADEISAKGRVAEEDLPLASSILSMLAGNEARAGRPGCLAMLCLPLMAVAAVIVAMLLVSR